MAADYGKTLAANVGQLLRDSRLTQDQFGSKVGLSQPGLARILGGGMKNPQARSLDRIGAPWGKDAIWLLTDHAKRPLSDDPLRRWNELGPIAADKGQLGFLIEAAERLLFGFPQSAAKAAPKKAK